jgi:hypothetical protein
MIFHSSWTTLGGFDFLVVADESHWPWFFTRHMRHSSSFIFHSSYFIFHSSNATFIDLDFFIRHVRHSSVLIFHSSDATLFGLDFHSSLRHSSVLIFHASHATLVGLDFSLVKCDTHRPWFAFVTDEIYRPKFFTRNGRCNECVCRVLPVADTDQIRASMKIIIMRTAPVV